MTLISLFITLFGIVAGVMASCCSMGLYVDERLEDEEENKRKRSSGSVAEAAYAPLGETL